MIQSILHRTAYITATALFAGFVTLTSFKGDASTNTVKKPSALELAKKELYDARIDAMKAQIDYETCNADEAKRNLEIASGAKQYYLKSYNLPLSKSDSLRSVNEEYDFLCKKEEYAQLKADIATGKLYQKALSKLKEKNIKYNEELSK